MPKYDVSCIRCGSEKEIFMTFKEYDEGREHGIPTYCSACRETSQHEVFMKQIPSVEWRTDGSYSYDNADQWTRYQRDHYSESGDRSDKKLAMRKRRRPNLGYIE